MRSLATDWCGGVQVRVGVFGSTFYTRVFPFATAPQIIPVIHGFLWSFGWAISCVPARIRRELRLTKIASCTADRTPQLGKLFESVFGQVRTATKRAGGVTRNHGGSAGRRLGVKKFTGEAPIQTSTAVHIPIRASFL